LSVTGPWCPFGFQHCWRHAISRRGSEKRSTLESHKVGRTFSSSLAGHQYVQKKWLFWLRALVTLRLSLTCPCLYRTPRHNILCPFRRNKLIWAAARPIPVQGAAGQLIKKNTHKDFFITLLLDLGVKTKIDGSSGVRGGPLFHRPRPTVPGMGAGQKIGAGKPC